MALSYGVSDYVEGGIITAVIVLNVLIGFYQEYQAEKKMDSLRALSSPTANVLRGGHIVVVPSAEVVPGDIVLINTGDTVPADLRLFETMNLECDEKILTGEGMAVVIIRFIVVLTYISHARYQGRRNGLFRFQRVGCRGRRPS